MLKCKKQFYWLEGVPHDLAKTPEDKEKFCNAITSVLEKNNNN